MTLKTDETLFGAPVHGMFSDRWGSRICFAPEGDGGGDGGEPAGDGGEPEGDGGEPNGADPAPAGDDPAPKEPDPNPTQEQDPEPAPGSDDWRSGIADEKLKKHAERFTSVEEMAKAHLDLRTRLSKSVNAPSEDATPEEVAEYREKMGIPESEAGYEAPKIEGYEPSDQDNEFRDHMAPVFHKHHISKDAWDDIVTQYGQHLIQSNKAAVEAQAEADQTYLNQSEAALRKSWGKDYNANLRYSQEGTKHFFEDDIGQLELKNGQLLGSHPSFMKGMASIGRMHGEGVVQFDVGSDGYNSLREQADNYREKRDAARAAGRTAEAQRFDRLERETLAQMNGNGPIVGTQTRQV